MNTDNTSSSNLEEGQLRLAKIKTIGTLIASIIIPVLVFFGGIYIENSLKERERALKYIEISVNILREPPSKETTNLRAWAIDNINRFSEIKLSKSAINELQSEGMPSASEKASSYSYTTPDNPRNIRYLIITDTESPSTTSLKRSLSKPNANVSYHYIIDIDGGVEQLVDDKYIAWHAGKSSWKDETNLNPISIGIGLVHLSSKDGTNWANLDANHSAIGPDYPEEQMVALTELLTILVKEYDLTVDSILTKQHVAPKRRRTDLYGARLESIKEKIKNKLSN